MIMENVVTIFIYLAVGCIIGWMLIIPHRLDLTCKNRFFVLVIMIFLWLPVSIISFAIAPFISACSSRSR
ncbi:high-affinity K+ transport system ATPase subunit B [Scopulibacillus daqui]|uniref:High-affinity K+ transport system ATPase subunit B n=1 Tax=Scopulibacillus daqui TaxID=1469162 RepID=A0ABS2Q346_9BACL|nr:hypothetical protein [Scopulibacillus daqui]MBM7646715.1 high-affinity K+ transport system ATPase subunit B [Scopulibacillus daqui]